VNVVRLTTRDHLHSSSRLDWLLAVPMIILETERLTLRHFEIGDLDALYRLYRDPQIRAHFPDGARTFAETKEELEWFLHGHPTRPELGLWAAVERGTGAFLGRCGLLPWTIDGRPEVELAYLIDRARWGEGLATEAARGIIQHAWDELDLKRLICLIMPGNAASVAVATKVGMGFEREHRSELGMCHIYSLARLNET
jgi:RimJ/RimL family protein N-acetyltransferase